MWHPRPRGWHGGAGALGLSPGFCSTVQRTPRIPPQGANSPGPDAGTRDTQFPRPAGVDRRAWGRRVSRPPLRPLSSGTRRHLHTFRLARCSPFRPPRFQLLIWKRKMKPAGRGRPLGSNRSRSAVPLHRRAVPTGLHWAGTHPHNAGLAYQRRTPPARFRPLPPASDPARQVQAPPISVGPRPPGSESDQPIGSGKVGPRPPSVRSRPPGPDRPLPPESDPTNQGRTLTTRATLHPQVSGTPTRAEPRPLGHVLWESGVGGVGERVPECTGL